MSLCALKRSTSAVLAEEVHQSLSCMFVGAPIRLGEDIECSGISSESLGCVLLLAGSLCMSACAFHG
jgi:hypothetical protein